MKKLDELDTSRVTIDDMHYEITDLRARIEATRKEIEFEVEAGIITMDSADALMTRLGLAWGEPVQEPLPLEA